MMTLTAAMLIFVCVMLLQTTNSVCEDVPVMVTGRVECDKMPRKDANCMSTGSSVIPMHQGTCTKNDQQECTEVTKTPLLHMEKREEPLPTGISSDNITIVTRAEWDARQTKEVEYMQTPSSILFIHHTAMEECHSLVECSNEVKFIQDFHMGFVTYKGLKRNWSDIGYNFLIGSDGRVYEGRGWDRVGAHTLGWNNVSVSFSVMGDYTDHLPNQAALDAISHLIYRGIILRKLTVDFRLYGHRDARPTESPGEALYKLIRTWDHYDPKPPVKPTYN